MENYFLNQAEYGTHRLIASEIGEDKLVLDIGCNKGYLKQLVSNNIFYGIDYDKNDLEGAKKEGFKKVYHLDLNNYQAFRCRKKFDVIVFADVLEHLLYPDKVLRYFINNSLKENGRVIISLPNVANISIRLNLLLGRFNYTESGILDRGHLHLYTLSSARKLISFCRLKIIREKFSSNLFGKIIKNFPFLGTFLGFNLIFVCKR